MVTNTNACEFISYLDGEGDGVCFALHHQSNILAIPDKLLNVVQTSFIVLQVEGDCEKPTSCHKERDQLIKDCEENGLCDKV